MIHYIAIYVTKGPVNFAEFLVKVAGIPVHFS